MPHRTVFQWGKNHAHPFTMFIGGLVVGALVTGFGFIAFQSADDADVEIETTTTTTRQAPAATVASPTVSPSPSAAVSF